MATAASASLAPYREAAFNEAVDLFGANNDPVMAVAHQMNSSVPPG